MSSPHALSPQPSCPRPRPRDSRLPIAWALVLTLVAAAPLSAQGPGTFELFASRKKSASQPVFGGISFAHYGGPIGLRFSGALNFRSADNNSTTAGPSLNTAGYDCRYYDCHYRSRGRGGEQVGFSDMSVLPSIGGWNADVDLIVAPVRAVAPLRALLLGFSPYGFVGVGGYSVHPANAIDTTRATWSLGAGAHHQLIGALGVAAEARYRQPFTSDSIAPDWKQKLEYRATLTISFGGRPKRTHPTVVRGPAPAAPCSIVPCSERVESSVDPRLASRVLDVAWMMRSRPA